jgi:ParB family chromosome partitioning protein
MPAALSITLDRIDADPDQPRREFTQEDLDQLAASIGQLGILQPIIVRYVADKDRYVVVDGERRLRASKQVGLEFIPALIRHTEDADLLRDALLENLHRANLNALEEAEHLSTTSCSLVVKHEVTLKEQVKTREKEMYAGRQTG